jgi:hypothetical protein
MAQRLLQHEPVGVKRSEFDKAVATSKYIKGSSSFAVNADELVSESTRRSEIVETPSSADCSSYRHHVSGTNV